MAMRPNYAHGQRTTTDALRLVGITRGAEFDVDLAAFPEAEPVFAYVDDCGDDVLPLRNLALAGTMTIEDQAPYLWLEGPRRCVLLKASAAGREGRVASFRSRAVGEFCMEIYHVRPDGTVALLFQDDFCFK